MSGFLLDTNVPSELTRSTPNSQVKEWVDAQDNGSLYLSAVSVGELRRGITLLAKGKQREKLEIWLEQHLLPLFAGNILPVTQMVGNRWGILDAECQLRGTPLNTADGLIAATAFEHGFTIVTRNKRDFAGLAVSVLDPWEIL